MRVLAMTLLTVLCVGGGSSRAQDVLDSAPQEGGLVVYEVQAGDSLYSIAQRYGVLYQENGPSSAEQSRYDSFVHQSSPFT